MGDSATPMDCSLPGSSVDGILQARIWSGSHSLLQGVFPTQGLNPGLLHCRWMDSLMTELPGKPMHRGSTSVIKLLLLILKVTVLWCWDWDSANHTSVTWLPKRLYQHDADCRINQPARRKVKDILHLVCFPFSCDWISCFYLPHQQSCFFTVAAEICLEEVEHGPKFFQPLETSAQAGWKHSPEAWVPAPPSNLPLISQTPLPGHLQKNDFQLLFLPVLFPCHLSVPF